MSRPDPYSVPIVLCAVLSMIALSTASFAGTKTAEFNHGDCIAGKTCTRFAELTLKPGELFTIVIENTFPDQFYYQITGIMAVKEEVSPSTDVSFAPNGSEKKTLSYAHDPKYGGYIVRVTPKQGAQLGTMEITIAVQTSEWKIGFAGGFVGSGLTDGKYYVQSEGDTLVLRQDSAGEDAVRLGIASFVHVWHSKVDWIGLSLGLGLEAGSNITYYVGPCLRAGDKAALDLGLAVGSVTTHPTGTQVDKPVSDPSVVSNLGRRNTMAFFVSLSYSFIGGAKDNLTKPFAGK